MNEAVRCNRRSATGPPAGPGGRALLALIAVSFALGAAARPQEAGSPPGGAAAHPRASGRVDGLLRAWSDLYLSAWSDSLGIANADSLRAAYSDSLIVAYSDSFIAAHSDSLIAAHSDSLRGEPRTDAPAAHVILTAGWALEGLDESFGYDSLVPLSATGSTQAETAAPSGDTLEVPVIRFAERTTAWMGVVGLQARTREAAGLDASLSFQSRIGARRADLAAELQAAPRRGPGRSVTVRDVFLWDRADDGTTSRQNLLFLRWRPPLGPRGWRWHVGWSLDVSRSEDADIELEPGAGVAADSILRLTQLNYERYGLRLELRGWGLRGSWLAFDLGRKSVGGGSGSYSAGALSVNHTWLLAPGSLDLDLDLRRRRYDERTAVLGSYWESELRARWLGTGSADRLDAQLRAQATLRDEQAAIDEDDLLGFAGDQVIVRAETLLRHRLVGSSDRARAGGRGWEWEAGAGPVAQLIRTRTGAADAGVLGLRAESDLRGVKTGAAWWIDGSVEIGWRRYRHQRLEQRLVFEGFTLSLAQTDYRYAQISVIGGGELPWSLAWEGYASLDQEWHTPAADDARLISFSLTLKRLWALWGRAQRSGARLH